jgi:glycosyltransferase involved in cell wall biosynthesis
VVAAGCNFLFSSLMGRWLEPPVFGELGVLIAALLALIGPVNALSGGTEMFAALHDRFPRGRKRLIVPAFGVAIWGLSMTASSPMTRAAGWFALGASTLVLLAWNRGALVGLGRFGFVGISFVVEGVSRLALPVVLVALGLSLEGAAAGLVLGMVVALVMTETAIPRSGAEERQALGREVWIALAGLAALGVTQIVDVFAIRLVNGAEAGPYVAAASLARIALFSQMPAAAFALRRAAIEGPRIAFRRVLPIALLPGLVSFLILEAAPDRLLRLAYGDRFLEMGGTVRLLSAAMLLGGLATVGAQLLMGARSVAWAYTIVPVSLIGSTLVITMAGSATSVAVFSLAIQAATLLAIVIPVSAAVRNQRDPERRVLILNWRDRTHPQGGGSEVYVERLAELLAASGQRVTIFCAAHEGAASDEGVNGVRYIRRGTWRTVYGWALLYHLLGRLGPHDVVLDVKNGIPFFAPLYCRKPVVCLVHHVHRDQWAMNFTPRQARLGWWMESRLSPRMYRSARYVAVSEATRAELRDLGVDAMAIEVIRNGGATERSPHPGDADHPTIVYLGRLVPHKRVELLLDAAAELRAEVPELRVQVVGTGPWETRLRAHAELVGVADITEFTGWVDEPTKGRLLARAWVLALPSVTEGWGLAVMEAGACGTPSVAFRVGGLGESIVDGVTGLLVDDPGGLPGALRSLLTNEDLRARLGREARSHAARYSWAEAAARYDALFDALLSRQPSPVAASALEVAREP